MSLASSEHVADVPHDLMPGARVLYPVAFGYELGEKSSRDMSSMTSQARSIVTSFEDFGCTRASFKIGQLVIFRGTTCAIPLL
ncbi:hypothetical protein BDL97_11G051000 [Sphagnum fallax]|nr:hypothetical protein BDL97_11G051000 [Sphagnum fallax]